MPSKPIISILEDLTSWMLIEKNVPPYTASICDSYDMQANLMFCASLQLAGSSKLHLKIQCRMSVPWVPFSDSMGEESAKVVERDDTWSSHSLRFALDFLLLPTDTWRQNGTVFPTVCFCISTTICSPARLMLSLLFYSNSALLYLHAISPTEHGQLVTFFLCN